MSLQGGFVNPDSLLGGDMLKMSPAEQTEFLAHIFFSADHGLMLGPYLAGMAIDIAFMGVVVAQFLRWQGRSKGEHGVIKLVVYSTVIVSVAYTVFSVVYAMRNFVYAFGRYANFADAIWMQFFVLGDAIIATIIQAFYAERAFKLLGYGRRWWGLVFLVMLACCIVAELGGTFAAIVVANTRIKSLLDTFPVLYVWLTGQVAADGLITVVTAFALWKTKTGVNTTDRLLKRLVTFNIETQLPPTLIAMAMIIYFALEPQGTVIIALK